MSQYTQLRTLLKEDIHELVEKELFSRMSNIIPALMPAVLEFVAQSTRVYITDTGSIGDAQQQVHVMFEYVDPLSGTVHQTMLHTQKTLNPDKVSGELFHLTEFYHKLDKRVEELEYKAPSRNTDTGFF
jgi:hypothetical protein